MYYLDLNKEELFDLVKKMNISNFKEEQLAKLFSELDINGDGKISLEEISIKLEQFSGGNMNSPFMFIYQQMQNMLTSDSEKIIFKLKSLKQRATFKDDQQSVEDIDW